MNQSNEVEQKSCSGKGQLTGLALIEELAANDYFLLTPKKNMLRKTFSPLYMQAAPSMPITLPLTHSPS